MKKRDLFLTIILILSFLGLYGCGNDGTSVLELEFPTDFNKDEVTHFDLISANWDVSKHEILGNTKDTTNSNGVTMEIKKDSSSPVGATFIFENGSNKKIVFDNEYALETKVDSTWYEIPVISDKSSSRGIGYELGFGQSKEFEIDWQELYGELEPGAYRIIKDLADFKSRNNCVKDYMACEFDIE